jgi:hypothetical protein
MTPPLEGRIFLSPVEEGEGGEGLEGEEEAAGG